jgi:hypothetical protein
MADLKARFEVHKLEGTGTRTIAKPKISTYLDDIPAKDSDGEVIMKSQKPVLAHKAGDPILNDKGATVLLGGFDYEDMVCDAGWMVYFPSGSSIHVWTEEEMIRQGFLKDPTMVDMETGDDHGTPSLGSLKSLSEQKEVITKSSRHADHK